MEENSKDLSENEEIKSTAVVKYSFPKPAQFMKLQCNTDLNLPPSNWLSSSADSYGLQHVLTHHKGFSRYVFTSNCFSFKHINYIVPILALLYQYLVIFSTLF